MVCPSCSPFRRNHLKPGLMFRACDSPIGPGSIQSEAFDTFLFSSRRSCPPSLAFKLITCSPHSLPSENLATSVTHPGPPLSFRTLSPRRNAAAVLPKLPSPPLLHPPPFPPLNNQQSQQRNHPPLLPSHHRSSPELATPTDPSSRLSSLARCLRSLRITGCR
jgi:hypothetical protein